MHSRKYSESRADEDARIVHEFVKSLRCTLVSYVDDPSGNYDSIDGSDVSDDYLDNSEAWGAQAYLSGFNGAHREALRLRLRQDGTIRGTTRPRTRPEWDI